MAQAGRLPVALADWRMGVGLLGTIDGVNMVFTTPETFRNTASVSIMVHYNGQRLFLTSNYTLSESGGAGTGFDTVNLCFAPKPGDRLDADYLAD